MDQTRRPALPVETAASKLLPAFKRPFDLGSVHHGCTTSIGVTLFGGQSATIDDLFKQALVLQREFVLHYQPQWDRQGRLIGLEAMVR